MGRNRGREAKTRGMEIVQKANGGCGRQWGRKRFLTWWKFSCVKSGLDVDLGIWVRNAGGY